MLGFIQHYLHEHRQSPLIREIQLGCAIASYKSAVDRLNSLEHKGFIRRIPNKHRGIRIAKRTLESSLAAGGAAEEPFRTDGPAAPSPEAAVEPVNEPSGEARR